MELSKKVDIKEEIIKVLRRRKELYTKSIAKEVGVSVTTASKYLSILKAEGKVKSRYQKPYIYWEIKEGE